MKDPGHPFSVPYKKLIESFEERIREGVEQEDQIRLVFKSAVTTYPLPRTAYDIKQVTGVKNDKFTVFNRGQDKDYKYSNNQIIWTDPEKYPDEGSKFDVEYIYRERPAGLTDFTPGSVTGTLIRAVSREIKLLYEQMDQAYRRAFINIASGVALDNVVALVGVERNQALKASGYVTFFRKNATSETITIESNTRITDENDRIFLTTEQGILESETTEFGFQDNRIIIVKNKIADLEGIWLREDDPDITNSLLIEDTNTNSPYGEDERTITLADDGPAEELQIKYKAKSVTVAIEAMEAGPEGNVNAGTIVIMPTPPKNIDGVINEEATSGGKIAEPDEQLRERAKHALEQTGNATLNAIKYAVLDVDGIDEVQVIDHSIDDTISLGEVKVRYSGVANIEDVQTIVNQSRAAGIKVSLDKVNIILISGKYYLIPDLNYSISAKEDFLDAIEQYVEALKMGQQLSLRRLNALIYNIDGLVEVAEAQLQYPNPDNPGNYLQISGDPFIIQSNQLLRPDFKEDSLRLVQSLHATDTQKVNDNDNHYKIVFELKDDKNSPISFLQDFSINVNINLKASSGQINDFPSLQKVITFSGSNEAIIEIVPDDIGEVSEDVEIEVLINCTAYTAIQTENATVTIQLKQTS